MKDYKKVLLDGLKKSSNVQEEERDCIKEAIKETYLDMVEELDARLGLELFDYRVEVRYYSDGIPERFKHILWVKFSDETMPKMSFRGAMQQVVSTLSTGDDEVKIISHNTGLKIEIVA